MAASWSPQPEVSAPVMPCVPAASVVTRSLKVSKLKIPTANRLRYAPGPRAGTINQRNTIIILSV